MHGMAAMFCQALYIGLLFTCQLVVMAWAEKMCTKSVPVQREPSKKVHVLRRVPASCSNWEKAWSWITKKECGTKYRLDYVSLPSREAVTYRKVQVCCEDDIKCKEANGLEASGMDMSDEKFLAIVLGSTAALFILILIITISLCRKKKQCSLPCEERRHIYASAEEADESSELQNQKQGCRASEDEAENKVCESEYAEINDSGLPRYTDIFKEQGTGGVDPFTKASAPPLPVYDNRGDIKVCQTPCENSVKDVLKGMAHILEQEHKQPQGKTIPPDADYYNLAEKQKLSALSEDAILNLTEEDSAVMSGNRNVLPSENPSTKYSGQDDGATVLQPCNEYEHLAQVNEVDKHQYQCLASNTGEDTKSMPTEVAEKDGLRKDDKDVSVIDPPSPLLQPSVNGHIDSSSNC